MRIFLVGREGQLARSLISVPAPDGIEVSAIGRPEFDLTRRETLAPILDRARPDLVVNPAAYTAVDKAESEPDMAWAVNMTGAAALAKACGERGLPLVHISTDYVFTGNKPGPYVETDLAAPVCEYGRSKLAGEQAVMEFCPKHIILRTAWVHSPYGNNFVKTILRLASTRPEISVVDDQLGSPTYAPHLAELILRVASRLSRSVNPDWGIYHATGAGETTWCRFARELLAVSARHGGPSCRVKPISTAEYPTSAKRPTNSRLDNSKTVAAFGASLPDWHDGVAACVPQLLSAQ